MKRKWIPIKEKIIETEKYRYIIGRYNHLKYGNNCFRISKFLKINGFFIGHFVIVPSDEEKLKDDILDFLLSGNEKQK